MAERSGARGWRASTQESLRGPGARFGSFGTVESALAEAPEHPSAVAATSEVGGYPSWRAAPFLFALLTAALVPKTRAARRRNPACATNNQGDVNQEPVR